MSGRLFTVFGMIIILFFIMKETSTSTVSITPFKTVAVSTNESVTFTCITTHSMRFISFYDEKNGLLNSIVAYGNINGSCLLLAEAQNYNSTCSSPEGPYTMTIISVTEEHHNKIIRCTVRFGSLTEWADTRVFVQISITSVVLSTATTTTTDHIEIVNGTTQLFTCTTSAGRPSSRIQWYLGDVNVTSEAIIQPDVCNSGCDGNVISSSIFAYTGTVVDTGRTLYCTAVNIDDGRDNLKSNKITIKISYGPLEVVMFPTRQYYLVNETDNVGPVTCTAECSPECNMHWIGPNLPSLTANILHLQNISRNQAGTYQCTANNTVGAVNSDPMEVVINYGPMKPILSPSVDLYTVFEGDSISSITCTADCKPKCNITWTGPSLSNEITPILNLTKLSRNQSGNYFCTARNMIRHSNSDTIHVDVYYGVKIFPIKKKDITEGEEINVTCNGQSNPPVTNNEFTWTRPGNGSFRQNGRNLVIKHANKRDTGTYICSIFKTISPSISKSINFSETTFVDIDVDSQCNLSSAISTQTHNTIFGAGIVMLVVGIFVILLIFFCYLVYRSRLRKGKGNSSHNQYTDVNATNPSFADAYETLDQEKLKGTGTGRSERLSKNVYEEFDKNVETDEHVYKGLKLTGLGKDQDIKKGSEYANVDL